MSTADRAVEALQTMTDFIEMPKIARLSREIIVTEKLDGNKGAA